MKLIAEIGWNHMGDMDLAKKMIEAAASSGANYCKFQTWSEKKLVPGSWDNDGRREIYKKAELSESQHYYLKEYCEKKNTKFLTTIFNIDDLDFLYKLNPEIIKIGSPEVYNLKLIESCLERFSEVLVSTGAAKWSEIQKIANISKKDNLVLLHCVSSYPCNAENINFPRMEELKKITKVIGFSGHYDGIDDAKIALCKGAYYVEKHFTIDKNLPGRDNKFAILPNDLLELSKFKKNLEAMDKNQGLDLQKCEQEVYSNARGRWSK
tara:strand:- start:96 stop:893 length:798 start_codon:yes stop_codon:yes gene_type:complete